ncbi:MAG: beta-ketoacyl synthase N-terminal-like domain-containing protein [Elusimicrobiota bacterium]|nr:beta-ketoacyl synthase N-terminal-like domain-containing protein [Elusimicrobiota bacterium]
MPKKDSVPAFTPLAVIGIGGVFPKAGTIRQFWANIKNKVDAIQDVPATHWSKDDYYDATKKGVDTVYACKGGFLDQYDFDPSEFGLAPNTLEATDPAQLFGLVAAKMALADAGYPVDKETWDRSRVSTILGVTGTLEIVIPLGARLSHPQWRKALDEAGVPKAQAEEVVARMADSYVPWQEASFPGLLGNVVSGRIANRFNLGGTNCTVDAACGSSLSALHMASLELQAGRAKMVVTGGVDTFNDIFMYTCFTKTPALSPGGHAKPFDAKADGTTLGEGVGMVVLKRLDEAQADGDRVIAVLRGIGSSSDGRGKSIYAPSAGGQTRALEEAYRVSGVSPDTVELVEAHGTGTAVGDGIEVEALAGVYNKTGRKGRWVALGSVKSMVGHTKAAAGAAAFVKAAMALRHKTFPPTLKVTEPHPVLAKDDTPFYLSLEKRPWMAPEGHPRRAACSALGFGGTNFHAVLEEASSAKTETDWDGEHEIFASSGDSSSGLASLAAAKNWDEVRLACHASRRSFDGSASKRLVIVLERGCDWKAVAEKAKALKTSPLDGIYCGEGKPGKLAVLFPGQGSQYVGMSRDLVCAFPEAFDALAEADAAFDDGRLSDLMFPRPVLKPEEKEAQEKALRDTSVAQPALGAAALSAWRVLSRFGVKADAAAGHSYGELVALHAAGRFDAETLHVLSRLRGKLMKGDGSDKGSMLAVVASFDAVEKAVAEEGLDLVIANRNAPTQNVLSGATPEIEKAQERLTKRGLKCVRLPVAAAFHSALVEPALKPFGAALEKVAFSKPSIPVYANSTGAPYPDAPKASRELLAGQLGKPVEFVKLVSNMAADGVTTFVECGSGGRLTGLVSQIVPGAQAVAVDASNGKKNGIADLAKTLAQLAALGHAVDLKDWQGGDAGVKDARPKPKLSVALTGATYRSTPKKQFEKKSPAAAPAAPASVAPTTMTNTDPSLLGQALAAAQSSIEALNRLQEQTAALHLQFLQSQEASQRHIQTLVEQQQAVVARLAGGAPLPVAPMPAYVPPAPVSLPVAAPRPAPVAAPAPAPAAGVLPVLLAIVSEKTGYPAETLNADMDLEGDLGIDSIKRVEILSAVREKLPGAPQVKPEHLGTLRTLRSIADYLSNGMAAPAAAPAVAPAVVAPAAAPSAGVLPVLLGIVAEKTGYPADTLNPDMDLEGDLGIDSIKRVEILSAVREKLPGAPQVKPEHLGTLRTLRSIADYLSQGMAPSAPTDASPASTVAGRSQAETAPAIAVLPVLLGIVAEKTGYPADTLNPDMDLEGDLGIDSIKRVEILSAVREKLPAAPQVKPEHLGTLRTLRSIADYLLTKGTGTIVNTAQLTEVPGTFVNSGRLTRMVPVLAPVGPRDAFPLKGVVIAVTKDSGLDQALAAELKGRGLDATVVALDRPEDLPADLGALLIIAPARAAGPGCPWTAESEVWLKKAFLLAQAAGRSFAARKTRGLLATVTRLDGGLGLLGGGAGDPSFGGLAGLVKTAAREWPGVVCRALDVDPALPLPTAAALLAKELGYEAPVEAGLAASGVKTVVLEERPAVAVSGEPLAPGDVVIVTGGARGVTAECAVALAAEFKPNLVLVGRSPLPGSEDAAYASAKTEGELRSAVAAREKGLAPKAIGEKAKELLAAREIRSTLARLKELGCEARYRACDARDAAAVKALVAEVGPVAGLVHGAGVLADKALLEKTPAMLDAVLDAKLGGLRHFLDAVELPKLKVLALFSSSTARFGRVGQSDYAVANEALNKAAQLLAKRLPSCRVASLGWGPWDGGMVDKNLKALFASEGVGVIGLQDGGAHLVAELRGPAPETVVIAELPGKAEDLPVVFERALTLEDAPVLNDHAFAGRAVLPLALSAEWLAHAALHANPGLSFLGFDDLRVVKGVFVSSGKATAVTVRAGAARKQGEESVVPAEIRGADGALQVSARVVLGARRPKAPAAALEPSGPAYKGGVARAYGEVLFHGGALRVIKAVPAMGPDGFCVEAAAAPAPSAWTARPPRDRWLSDPGVLDAAFQAMILWSVESAGAPCLPSFVARYRQFADRFPETGARVVAKTSRRGDGVACADLEFTDERGALVARLEGHESTVDAGLAAAFRRNTAGV